MKKTKVTKGAKGASSTKSAAEHLFWGHPRHEEDRTSAETLRKQGGVLVSRATKSKANLERFPHAAEVQGTYKVTGTKNGVLSEELDKNAKKDEKGVFQIPEWLAYHEAIHTNRDFYLRKGNQKHKKDKQTGEFKPVEGEFYVIKQKTKGVKEMSISLPAGWVSVLNDKVHLGDLKPEELKRVLKEIGETLLETLSERTGYTPLYFTIHPDSPTNVHFHLGVASVDPEFHTLLGRNEGGLEGKKGIREAGFSFLNIWRHAQKMELKPKDLEKFEARNLKLPRESFAQRKMNWDGTETEKNGGLDDIALAKKLGELLDSHFSFGQAADKKAAAIASRWAEDMVHNGRTHAEKDATIELLREKNAELKKFPFKGKTRKEAETIWEEYKKNIGS